MGRIFGKDNIEYIKALSGMDEDLILEVTGLSHGHYIAFL